MAYLSRGFLLAFVTAYIFLLGSLAIQTNNAFQTSTLEEANQTLQQIQTERQTITAQKIFLNNLVVSLSLVVPLVGLIPFYFVWMNTGTVIGLLAKAMGIPPSTYILNLTVLAFPEMAGYALLMAENLYVSFLALFRAGAKQRITTQSWKTLIIYVILLYLGALAEAAMIG